MLDSERKRNQLYAAEIGKPTRSRDRVAQSLLAQNSLLMNQLTTLSSKLHSLQKDKTPDSSQELKGIMQECLKTVRGLHNGAGIRIEVLQKSGISVRDYANRWFF